MNIKTLDLRELAPFERHTKIFQMWDSLENDKSLRIINGHDSRRGMDDLKEKCDKTGYCCFSPK